MTAKGNATNLLEAAHHRRLGSSESPKGGGVLTPEPSGNCRAGARSGEIQREPLSAGVSRAFAGVCAPGSVAMRSRFDRLREVANRSIYNVILDRHRVLESLQSLPGGIHPDRYSGAGRPEAAASERKFPKDQDFSIPRDARSSALRRQWAQESASCAWYVDCTSRPRGSAEGEGNQ